MMAIENFQTAKLSRKIRVLKGEARSVLRDLREPYDFIFEDATFGKTPEHYNDLIRLLKLGGYLQFSNWFPIEPAIIGGKAMERWKHEFKQSKNAPEETKRFVEHVLHDHRLSAIILPNIWIGMAVKTGN